MPRFVPQYVLILDDVRKLRDRIRPAPGNLQREQFDLREIPFTVPQRCPKLGFKNLVEGHLEPVQ